MSLKSLIVAAVVLASLALSMPASAQTPGLKPFPLGGGVSGGPPKTRGGVTISVSYQFFLEGDTSSMEDQTSLADKGRKQLYILLANECVVLKQTIADTCAIVRANVNAQLRNTRTSRRTEGVRISGSASYQISLKNDDDADKAKDEK
jgi:hypothetical protein